MSNERYTCDCGCMGVGPALTHLMNSLGPKDAREHFRASRVEFLKGIRALIDDRINRLSTKPEAQGTTVPVE
jgi:hypothetical protein